MTNYLKPDKTTTRNDVEVNEYLLTNHNPNKINMPTASMEGKIVGVTIHNMDWISAASGTTPAEQYTRETVNGNMRDVRVHYYVDDTCAWQSLPHTLAGWHAADGGGSGNCRTIAIECIMSSDYNAVDRKSEDNAARLAAALLREYELGIDHLYTHTHWQNIKKGKTGTVDQLNMMYNSNIMCPAYILPHWMQFKLLVQKYMNALFDNISAFAANVQLYRIRKSWENAASQIGAYSILEDAQGACQFGYSVYDANGDAVYTLGFDTSTVGAVYQVKVTVRALNIRAGAGRFFAIRGCIRDRGVYTIVETRGNWGKLEARDGWICLDYTEKI